MAAFTATVNDSAGHSDGGRSRTVTAQLVDSAGHADGEARSAFAIEGVEPAGQRDAVAANETTAAGLTRTVTDSAGHGDPGATQDVAEVQDLDDDAGHGDTVTTELNAGGPPVPPGTPGRRPRVVVEMAIGSPALLDEATGFFRLGTSVLGGPDVLGSLVWVDVSEDFQSASMPPAVSDPLEDASPSTCSLVLDNLAGDYDPLNPASPYAGQLDVGQQVRLYAVDDTTMTVWPLWRGQIDDILPDYGRDPTVAFACIDGLATLGRVALGETPPVFDGDTSGQRIARILDAAQWPTSLRALDTGLSTVQGETYGGSALAVAQRIVNTELGALFVDGSGQIVFFDRLHVYTGPRSTGVRAVFSDTGDDIDMESLTGSLRRGATFNQARVTRIDGTEQVANDEASQAKRGILTFPGTVGEMHRNDQDAYAAASWVVARFKDPEVRFPEIPVDATAQGMWAQLLDLQRFDRVRVDRAYGPAQIPISRELLVAGIGHEITPTTWQMTFAVRDAETFTPFRLGTSVLGGPDVLV